MRVKRVLGRVVRVVKWLLAVGLVVLVLFWSVYVQNPDTSDIPVVEVVEARAKNYAELCDGSVVELVSGLHIGENTGGSGDGGQVLVSFVGEDAGGYFVVLNPYVSFRDDYFHGQGVVEPTKVYLGERVPWYEFVAVDDPSLGSHEIGSVTPIWFFRYSDGDYQSIWFAIHYNTVKE